MGINILISSVIPGTNGFNKMKSDGTLWSCRKKGGSNAKDRKGKWHKQKTTPGKGGYLQATLKINGRKKSMKIHTLMLLTFRGPKPKGFIARHFPDRAVINNKLENLSWCSHKTNQRDRFNHHTDSSGERQGASKLNWKSVRLIRKLHRKYKYPKSKIQKIFNNVTIQNIVRILNFQTWKE